MDSSSAESSAEATGQVLETPRWLPWLWSGLVLAGSATYAIASWTEDRNQGVLTILGWWRAVLGL
ncbi:hypothetical protein [Archangium sp.]|jgi:hypothetical protein|uniref:hypothetical protein n=1 Tax=Archangium sp. TaxID=1872627 RepID=UPI002ED9136E